MSASTPTVLPADAGALWYALAGRAWSALAVLCPDDPPRATWLAETMVRAAATGGTSVKAIDAVTSTPGHARALSHVIAPERLARSTDGTRYLVAVDSPLRNLAGLPVLTACDGVLLLLHRLHTRIPDARTVLELVGRDRVIGAVLGSW